MNLYIGNINFDASSDDIKALFEEVGEVEEVKIMIDKETGRSKGFAFVEMPDIEEAIIAMKTLNGRKFFDRNIVVNLATQEEGSRDRPFNKPRSYDDRGGGQHRNYERRDSPRDYNRDDRRSSGGDYDRPPRREYSPEIRESSVERPRPLNDERSKHVHSSDTPVHKESTDGPKRPRVLRPRNANPDTTEKE